MSDVNFSKTYDTIIIDDIMYMIGEWGNTLVIDQTYNTDDVVNTYADNIRSLILIKIQDEEIVDSIPIYYEWESPDYRIDTVFLGKDKNDNLVISIKHFDDLLHKSITINTSHSIIDSNINVGGLVATTNSNINSNGTDVITINNINSEIDYMFFNKYNPSQNHVVLSQVRPLDYFDVGQHINLEQDYLSGDYRINDIILDSNGNIEKLVLNISKYLILAMNYPFESNNTYKLYGGNIKHREPIDFDMAIFSIKQHTSHHAFSVSDIAYNIDNEEVILARYQQLVHLISIDGTLLSTEVDISNVVIKNNNQQKIVKTIKHFPPVDPMFGPIIDKIAIDKSDNIYLFGVLTNYPGNINVLIGDEDLYNKPINKTENQKLIILSKMDKDLVTKYTILFNFDTDSLFTKPIIKCDWDGNSKFTYFSFNFSKKVIIAGIEYTTKDIKIVNSIYGKIDNLTGEVVYINQIKSTIHSEIIDFDVDGNYLYILANYGSNVSLGNTELRANGIDNAFIIKVNKVNGNIITKENFYSDEKLDLMRVNADFDKVYLSGSWSGNIYINRNIKNSVDEGFFVTIIENL